MLRERGFTLLEVLVAFTIMALGLGALLQAFGSGLRAIDAGDGYALAVMRAQSKLAEVGPLLPLVSAEYAGDYPDGTGWRVRVAPFAGAPEAAVAYEVEVAVSRADGRGVVLRTLRLGGEPE